MEEKKKITIPFRVKKGELFVYSFEYGYKHLSKRITQECILEVLDNRLVVDTERWEVDGKEGGYTWRPVIKCKVRKAFGKDEKYSPGSLVNYNVSGFAEDLQKGTLKKISKLEATLRGAELDAKEKEK